MIFVTGGAGYIGSHTCVELLNAGHDVTVYDNFSNSSAESMVRVQHIAGKSLTLVQGDIRDGRALAAALADSKARAVVHFAGLKAVGELVQKHSCTTITTSPALCVCSRPCSSVLSKR